MRHASIIAVRDGPGPCLHTLTAIEVQLLDPVEAEQVLAFDGGTIFSSLTRQRVDVSGGFNVWSAVLGLADGRSVLLTSGTGSAVLAWELTPDEGIVMSQLGSHPQPIDEVIAGRVGGQDAVIGAYQGGTLMLWTPRPRPPGPVTQRAESDGGEGHPTIAQQPTIRPHLATHPPT